MGLRAYSNINPTLDMVYLGSLPVTLSAHLPMLRTGPDWAHLHRSTPTVLWTKQSFVA